MSPGQDGRRISAATTRVLASLAALAVIGLAVAGALGAGRDGGPPEDPIALSAARGSVSIGNSEGPGAIIEARNLLPGSSSSGSVRITNRGAVPFALSLAPRGRPDDRLAQALRMRVRDPALDDGGVLYDGDLAGMPRLPLGPLRPRRARRLQLSARLPDSAGDELQGRSTSVDLAWTARGAAPPPECRLRAMRARLFVFRSRNVIRLVTRYRARVGGRVAVDVYERRRGGRRGRKVGTLIAPFVRSPHRWRRGRVAQIRPPAEMRRFRRSRRGYIATLRVGRAPGYCSQHLNLDLVQLRRFFRQYVWFQRGSFRTR